MHGAEIRDHHARCSWVQKVRLRMMRRICYRNRRDTRFNRYPAAAAQLLGADRERTAGHSTLSYIGWISINVFSISSESQFIGASRIGATEIAGVDNVARAKKQGLKTREWTSRHEEAAVDIARVDNVARRSRGGQRRSERS